MVAEAAREIQYGATQICTYVRNTIRLCRNEGTPIRLKFKSAGIKQIPVTIKVKSVGIKQVQPGSQSNLHIPVRL
jgi:hypothetical protein